MSLRHKMRGKERVDDRLKETSLAFRVDFDPTFFKN